MKQTKDKSVGIFFVIKSKVIFHKEAIATLKPSNGFYDAELGHSEWFDDTLCHKYHEFEQYIEIPRGRVVYEIKKKKFIVYLDKKVDKETIKNQIIKAFDLSAQNTSFCHDAHYTTNPDEIEKLFS